MLNRVSLAAALALPCSSSATLLYATSYAGTVTTLNFTANPGSLVPIASSTQCGAQPSWVTLVGSNQLYCVDEAWGQPNGTLHSFSVADGVLTLKDSIPTIGGPVSTVVYGDGGKGLAVADYAESGFDTFNIANPSDLKHLQAANWVLPGPAPNPERQEKSHPHQAILDPTGRFILVPDLGFDRVHIFSVDKSTLQTTQQSPLITAPGSGPRHAVFVQYSRNQTYLYVIAELTNQILGYEVTYRRNGTLGFKQVWKSSTHGGNETLPAGVTGGEIAVSPDKEFLLVSSRFEGKLTIPNWDKTNSTKLPSDPIISFKINSRSGSLRKVQEFPAGGMVPRHFSLNKAGTLVAAAAQKDGRVVIISRDVRTGALKEYLANVAIAGEVNSAVWAE